MKTYRLGNPAVLLMSIAFALWTIGGVRAEVKLPYLISDHMVLQRGDATPLWGTATPGEEIKVVLGEVSGTAKADAEGKWRVLLDLSVSDAGPFQMTVTGKNSLVVEDVLVGEVWLCSGQSNMRVPLKQTVDANSEIARSEDSELRQFQVQGKASLEPSDTVRGEWVKASPKTSGAFSGVAYYFGRELRQTLQRPVGLILAAIGGSPAETWVSYEALASDPELKETADQDRVRMETYPGKAREYALSWRKWVENSGLTDEKRSPVDEYLNGSTDQWKEIKLLGTFERKKILAGRGCGWVRRTISLSEEQLQGSPEWALSVAVPSGPFEVYWNGTKVGGKTLAEFDVANTIRSVFPIPGDLVKFGEQTIAIRIFDPDGGLGISGNESKLSLERKQGTDVSVIPLAGKWKATMERELPPMQKSVEDSRPEPPQRVGWVSGSFFNSQIYPVLSYGMRGAIWYQGEANADRAEKYRTLLPMLIKDWRARVPGMFFFYIVQLPAFKALQSTPTESAWAELREAQQMATALEDTGLAVMIDVGEEKSIHPKDKQTPGVRLARAALEKTYGNEKGGVSPQYSEMQIEGDSIRISFKDARDGLVARPVPGTYVPKDGDPAVPLIRNRPDSELEGFAICGADRHWVWAEAHIKANEVIVRADAVKSPVAVRYGWADFPICNLYGANGLPVAPFRTDDFPLTGPVKEAATSSLNAESDPASE